MSINYVDVRHMKVKFGKLRIFNAFYIGIYIEKPNESCESIDPHEFANSVATQLH